VKLNQLFSNKMKVALKSELGIELDDNHDYSSEELETLYEQITDGFPYEYNENGMPDENGLIFEELIDVFIKNNLVCME